MNNIPRYKKTIICPVCKKEFKSLGYASHAAVHRRAAQKERQQARETYLRDINVHKF